jgi:acetyl esterase/lipase
MKHYQVHEDYEKLKIGVPMYAAETVPHSITTQKYTIESYEGYQLPIELLSPSHSTQKAPCILYLPGTFLRRSSPSLH